MMAMLPPEQFGVSSKSKLTITNFFFRTCGTRKIMATLLRASCGSSLKICELLVSPQCDCSFFFCRTLEKHEFKTVLKAVAEAGKTHRMDRDDVKAFILAGVLFYKTPRDGRTSDGKESISDYSE